MQVESTSCCGVNELHRIQGNKPETILREVFRDRFLDDGVNRPFYIFTDTRESVSGRNLARFITANGLGKIQKSPTKLNGNSGNWLTVWTWTVAQANCRKYALKNGIIDKEDY